MEARAKRSGVTAAYTVDSGLRALMELLPAVRGLPFPRVLVVAAGKGGAGKSSTASNVGGMLAAAGCRTLILDLDVQGNQSALLGVADGPRSDEDDEGLSFLTAVVSGNADLVRPILDVRPNLHLVTAGVEATRRLSDYLTLQKPEERRSLVRDLIDHLARLHQLDMVIVDSRPVGEILGEVALLSADYLAIPLKTDALSWKFGMKTIAQLYARSGASARLLGGFLFATGTGNTRIQADTRRNLEETLAGVAPVLQTVIPHSEKAAKDQSENGLTAEEYAMAAGELARPFWADPAAPTFASNSDAISNAYASLAVELVTEMLRDPDE